MMLKHPIEVEIDSDDPDSRLYRCTVCEFSFPEYHRGLYCKDGGHPAIWRDRYAINALRRVSGAERYGGYLA